MNLNDSNFDFQICNNEMRPIVDELKKKAGDALKHIDPDKILFIRNFRTAKSKKHFVVAKTAKIPPKWVELIFQMTQKSYFYMIEIMTRSVVGFDTAQMHIMLYRELRRIDEYGNIRNYNVQDWDEIIDNLGRRWFYPMSAPADILDDQDILQRLVNVPKKERPEEQFN